MMKCSPILLCTALTTTLFLTGGCKKEATGQPAANMDAAVAAAAQTPETSTDPNEVVASVNATRYLRKDMDQTVSALLKAQNIPEAQLEDARKHFEQRVVYGFIMKTLLLDEAKKQTVTVTEEDRKAQIDKIAEALKPQNKTTEQYFKDSPLGEKVARAEFEDGLVIDKLLRKTVLDSIVIDEEEVKKTLAEIEARNAEIAATNKNLIAINAERKAKIQELKKQLDNGADFAELAKAHSECPSKEQGGDLGPFTAGQMVKPFEDAAFAQEINKVGDIVETSFGYHLIKVTAKSPATEAKGDTPAKPASVTASHILIKTESPQELQEVPTSEQIQNHLKQQKSRAAVEKYIEGLKAAAKIETIYKEIPL
ncbi:MAG TPA: peptidylprolyl isomerase [Kiritimatiellia bacterium]|nr:peptidylprolyl isomerase [Kiritimatiellia bacterium]HOM58719.1 peptidylprolyl isomerase [Kiritimatiellia bacterium]HOR98152.1 peptidylprolyl isomerase [Kiritimatiellia bacterium]HPK38240.1 peptidylprolyl isomerase [Kiritimatiellia bacterium]HPW76043.1 peptidylprolyl isomerase [Kiritimatiellia bacterium]